MISDTEDNENAALPASITHDKPLDSIAAEIMETEAEIESLMRKWVGLDKHLGASEHESRFFYILYFLYVCHIAYLLFSSSLLILSSLTCTFWLLNQVHAGLAD